MRRILLLFASLLLLAAPVRGEDLSQFKTADELWAHIEEMEKQTLPRDPTQFSQRSEKLHSALLEFENRYPTDPRRWNAKLSRTEVESVRAQADNRRPDYDAVFAVTKNIIAAADAPAEVKMQARYLEVVTRIQVLESSPASKDSPAQAAAQASVAEFRRLSPNGIASAMMQLKLAQVLWPRDLKAAESILQELEGSKDMRIAALAQQQLDRMRQQAETAKRLDKLAKEPLDIKFKAVDGAEVDLAKLRGKVVLVDFWATWCGPCRLEIPSVVATYKQLHKDGFEIVGVSLDQDKTKLLNFTKQAGMTWPEYFDGKVWANEISSRNGVNAIPAAWLVDKKGFVRSTEARGDDLGVQVKKLLAE